jgi:hypothetical protein
MQCRGLGFIGRRSRSVAGGASRSAGLLRGADSQVGQGQQLRRTAGDAASGAAGAQICLRQRPGEVGDAGLRATALSNKELSLDP